MHYDIIIVTKNEIDETCLTNLNYLHLHDGLVTHGKVNSNTYDYLIIDQIYPDLNLVTEDGKIITNQFLKTSDEQIYAIGAINNSNKENQLQIIIDDIKNPF